MVSPRIFPMVPCGFPMVPCHGAAIRHSPAQLCGFPMVPCHGAAIRHSPAQLCLFRAAVPALRHPLPCRGLRRCSSLSGAAAQTLTPDEVCCWQGALWQICYWQSAQKPRFCARKARKRGLRRPKKHKNPDFVLEMPENEGSEAEKRTKTPILCSGREGIGIGKHNRRDAYRKRGVRANHRTHLQNTNTL